MVWYPNKRFFFLPVFGLLFFISCKKEQGTPRITIRQQPSKIAVFTIDTSTGAPSLQYEIKYFYNDSIRRFDSIDIAGAMYRFNYSKFSSEKKMLLNYRDSLNEFASINFDVNFYSMSSYQELQNNSTVLKTYNLQYDSYKKITGFGLVSNTSSENYTKTFTVKNDTTFIRTLKPASTCDNTDTLINTFVDMGTNLPYLLFFDITKDCSALENNILKALPVSNYINKLPFNITNANFISSFNYYGDAELRLKDALITVRERSTNKIHQVIKLSFTY